MKNRIKKIVVFSILHLTVLLLCITVSFSLGLDHFDTGEQATLLESITSTLSAIFSFPGTYLWTPWASKNLSNIIEWLVFIGNSILWGILLAYIYTFIKQRIKSKVLE